MLYLVAGVLEAGVAPNLKRRSFPSDSMKGGEGEGDLSPHSTPAQRTGWSAFPFLCPFENIAEDRGGAVTFHSRLPD